MSLALLFPGQGSQHAGALRWLDRRSEATQTLQLMAATLGADWRTRLPDAAWAASNEIAQPLVTGLSLAAWQCLADKLPRPAVIAGYSVGELAAFAAAGVFDASTAMTLAGARAGAMERSAAGHATGLMAVHATALRRIAPSCERHGLSLAIRLSSDSCIVGGLASSLDAAQAEWMAAGIRCTRLAIHVASHTRWMANAATEFAQRLGSVRFAVPQVALVCNESAALSREPNELARCLAAQIASPILWDSCLEAIAERGVRCVLEVGPGTALSALWRGRYPDIPVRSVDEFGSPEAVAAWVSKMGFNA
ncbi:MAG TPA: acyltransferase domain-containing protein [Burkholderiaceae bacterium]